MKKLLVLALALLSVAGIQAEKLHFNKPKDWGHGVWKLGQPAREEEFKKESAGKSNPFDLNIDHKCEKCGSKSFHKIKIHIPKPKPIRIHLPIKGFHPKQNNDIVQ